MITIIQMCKENDVMTQNILKIWYLQDVKFYYIFKSFYFCPPPSFYTSTLSLIENFHSYLKLVFKCFDNVFLSRCVSHLWTKQAFALTPLLTDNICKI